MKKLLLFTCFGILAQSAIAQITVTASDMPVSGDTLRTSDADPLSSNIDVTITGANTAWDFSTLVPINQTLIQYQPAAQINPFFIGSSAYGYKIADSLSLGLPIPLPVSIQNIYTFFEKENNPSTFDAVAYSASVSGFPLPANYSDPDEWYFFPLTYGNAQDSSTYSLTVSLPSIGSLKQQGYRLTTVDGWGTIKTPYYTTPVGCIRVRSEIDEIDSVTYSSFTFGIPRKSVDYKWLVNGDHYPALWVSTMAVGGTETPTTVSYRDSYRGLSVSGVKPAISEISLYPNPATGATIKLNIPASWRVFTAEVFDIQGKLIASYTTRNELPVSSLAQGQYLVRISSGNNIGYARFAK